MGEGKGDPVGMEWNWRYEYGRGISFFFFLIYLFACNVGSSIFIVACGTLSWSMQTLSCDMWDLVPWSRIEPGTPALGAWSLSHWIPGKSLDLGSLKEVWVHVCMFTCMHVYDIYMYIHAHISQYCPLKGHRRKKISVVTSTCSVHIIMSNTIPHWKQKGLLKEELDSRAGVREAQNEPRVSCYTRK